MGTKMLLIVTCNILLIILEADCQKKLVIKPGLSFSSGFNRIQNRLTSEKSFVSPKPGVWLSLNARVEYYINEKSFFDFTIKGSEAAFSFRFGIKNVFSYVHQTSAETTQFNLAYNLFLKKQKFIFKKITRNQIFFKPKLGVGVGLAINKSAKYYRTYFYNQYFGETNSLVSYWRLYTATPYHKISLQAFGKVGFSVFRNKKELFDLLLEYNKGLMNLTNVDLQYNINGTNYKVLLGSRGTNINLTVGIPLTLLRFNLFDK
jgi:hypothetical protein